MKIIVTIIPTDLVTNSFLSSSYPFLRTKDMNWVFNNLVLWWREICFLFIASHALYFKAMPNSIDFYKGIFLHVISVRIIVPWLNIGFMKMVLKWPLYSNVITFFTLRGIHQLKTKMKMRGLLENYGKGNAKKKLRKSEIMLMVMQ